MCVGVCTCMCTQCECVWVNYGVYNMCVCVHVCSIVCACCVHMLCESETELSYAIQQKYHCTVLGYDHMHA